MTPQIAFPRDDWSEERKRKALLFLRIYWASRDTPASDAEMAIQGLNPEEVHGWISAGEEIEEWLFQTDKGQAFHAQELQAYLAIRRPKTP